jgi:hypothetical protein
MRRPRQLACTISWPQWSGFLVIETRKYFGVSSVNQWLTGTTATSTECLSGDSSDTRNIRHSAHLCAPKSWQLCWIAWETHRACAVEITITLTTSQQVLVSGHIRWLRLFAHLSKYYTPLKIAKLFYTLYKLDTEYKRIRVISSLVLCLSYLYLLSFLSLTKRRIKLHIFTVSNAYSCHLWMYMKTTSLHEMDARTTQETHTVNHKPATRYINNNVTRMWKQNRSVTRYRTIRHTWTSNCYWSSRITT